MSPFIRPSAIREGDRWVALAVFAILLAFFTATLVTQPDSIDGEVEFQTTSALARSQTFALGETPESKAIVEARFNGRFGGPGREDEFFSWFGVGQAYVAVPFYLIGSTVGHVLPSIEERNSESTHLGVRRTEYFEHLLVAWRNPLLSAITAALIVLAARRLGTTRVHAFVAGVSYGLCTFAWPQARSTFNTVQATFFVFLAFHQVLVVEESFSRYRRPSTRSLLLCGVALGGAFLTRSLVAPALVVIGIALLVVFWKGKQRAPKAAQLTDIVWVLLPALACFGLFLWTNDQRFGDPFEQGYGDVITWDTYFNYPLHLGLAGILFSPGQGLFWMAPAALLTVLWIVRQLAHGALRMPLVVCGIAVATLVPVCMTVGWHGAWTYGPRYALPLLPFVWLGVAPMLDQFAEHAGKRLFAYTLLLAGLVVTLPGVLVDTTTHTDLAMQSAKNEWPDTELEGDAATADEERFQRLRWNWRYSAPWAHWRILRHRVSGLEESFSARQLFFVDAEVEDVTLVPAHARERGFSHLAWVDFATRLGGPIWPVATACAALLLAGIIAAFRGLDPDQR